MEDLWGLRSKDATGQHFFNLDIGLPTDRIRPLIRSVLGGADYEVRMSKIPTDPTTKRPRYE